MSKMKHSGFKMVLTRLVPAAAVVAWMGWAAAPAEGSGSAASTRSGKSSVSRSGQAGRAGGGSVRGGRSVAHRGNHGNRGHRTRRSHHGRSRGRSHSSLRLFFGYPYGYGYSSYGYGYYGSPYYSHYGRYGYPYYHPRYSQYYPRSEEIGGVDLNVRPKKAEVYLDGRLIGTAGKFDGYPSYLWLPKGAHQLVIYRPGHETVVREIEVLSGVVLDIDLDMQLGDATPPKELMVEPPVETAERGAERYREPRGNRGNQSRPSQRGYGELEPGSDQERPGTLDARGEPGRLVLRIEPDDASVYLDGRLLGTAGELSRLHAGLLVGDGTHKLEIVRPGYDAELIEFSVAGGEEETIELTMGS